MLLQVLRLNDEVKGTPLFAEVPVHEDTAPYLVTSNKGPLWIDRSFAGVVRSAVLRTPWKEALGETYLGVVRAVRQQGELAEWGNVFPNTPTGYIGAEAYLRSYGLEKFDLLAHGDENPWVPEGSAVLVPTDRMYLGFVGVFNTEAYTVVVHNPSRGMAVLGNW